MTPGRFHVEGVTPGVMTVGVRNEPQPTGYGLRAEQHRYVQPRIKKQRTSDYLIKAVEGHYQNLEYLYDAQIWNTTVRHNGADGVGYASELWNGPLGLLFLVRVGSLLLRRIARGSCLRVLILLLVG